MAVIVGLIKEAIGFGIVFLYGSTGETIMEKSGHLNLGVPGIMCLGAVGGALGANWAYNAGSGVFGVVVLAVLMAMVFGGLGGLLYGLFTITLRCNQNVTGLTLTTFGAGILGFWGTQMGDQEISFVDASRYAFTPSLFFGANVPDNWFVSIFLSHGVLVYLGIVIAIMVAVYMNHTRKGLALRAVGENPAAADAAGINVIAHKYVSCALGSAIAGIGGAFYLLDCTRGSLEYVIDAMGWIAVALVIFSLWRPGIGIFGAFIFGFLFRLPYSPLITGVALAEKELLKIIPYAATALVLIVISFFNKRETQPPTALGLPYFREDR